MTFEQIQARVAYPLRTDLPQSAKPYRCGACGVQHSYIGTSHELPTRNGGTKAVRFCAVCVADGTAVGKIREIVGG